VPIVSAVSPSERRPPGRLSHEED